MKRWFLVAAGLVAALALASSVSWAGSTPPSPPHEGHWTHCTLDVQGTTPFDEWQQVHMVLTAGDTFWIDSPNTWAGHYVIKQFRFVYADPDVLPTNGWSDWSSKGAKTGPSAHSTTIECMGSFADAAPPYWIDSIDVLLPAGK